MFSIFSKNNLQILLMILIYFAAVVVVAQDKKEKLWSNKDKKAFYAKYATDTITINELKIIDCVFEKIQTKFTSYKQYLHYPNSIIPIEKKCSLMVYVPITGQLSKLQAQIISNEMLIQLNNFRKENGNLLPLKSDADLDKAAKIQADYCAWNNELSHTQIGNNDYNTVNKRISMVKKNQPKGVYLCGENIASISYETEQLEDTLYLKEITKELLELWASSEGHRENMLYKNYRFFGFAITLNDDEEALYATQVFCY